MRRIKVDCDLLFHVEFAIAHSKSFGNFIFGCLHMYNGVGVQTARGTGTSGHVQKNLGSLRPLRHDVRKLKELRDKQPILREADPGIVHHNELRKIEVQLLEMREQWEDEYVSVITLN